METSANQGIAFHMVQMEDLVPAGHPPLCIRRVADTDKPRCPKDLFAYRPNSPHLAGPKHLGMFRGLSVKSKLRLGRLMGIALGRLMSIAPDAALA